MEESNADTERAVDRCRRQFPASSGGESLAFGFDGIVDTVREIIDERRATGEYSTVSKLSGVGNRIDESVDLRSSATFEWTEEATRTGGHVCHLSRSLGALGYRPTMIGTFGDPMEPIFEEEFAKYPTVSIGKPGYTDAVEFDDGKLLLTESGDYQTLDWEALCDRLGIDALAEYIDGKSLLGIGYWSLIPSLPDLLEGIRRELWPLLTSPPEHVLMDPADVRNMSASDIEDGARALDALDDVVETTVSANRSETEVLASHFDESVEDFEESVGVAREGLGVNRFVGHGVDRSASSTRTEAASVAVPRVEDPTLTTSAGDHFNAGLVVALLSEMDDDAALVLANATAGWFVRHGTDPSRENVREFVDSYASRLEETS